VRPQDKLRQKAILALAGGKKGFFGDPASKLARAATGCLDLHQRKFAIFDKPTTVVKQHRGREMDTASTAEDKRIDRRIVLKAGAALAAAGPAVLRGGPAEAPHQWRNRAHCLCRRIYDAAAQGAWRRH
jgi:hypothetical protein